MFRIKYPYQYAMIESKRYRTELKEKAKEIMKANPHISLKKLAIELKCCEQTASTIYFNLRRHEI